MNEPTDNGPAKSERETSLTPSPGSEDFRDGCLTALRGSFRSPNPHTYNGRQRAQEWDAGYMAVMRSEKCSGIFISAHPKESIEIILEGLWDEYLSGTGGRVDHTGMVTGQETTLRRRLSQNTVVDEIS